MARSAAGTTNRPFLALVDGGADGEEMQEMRDLFYYTQIRALKEDTKNVRKLDGTIPVEEVTR